MRDFQVTRAQRAGMNAPARDKWQVARPIIAALVVLSFASLAIAARAQQRELWWHVSTAGSPATSAGYVESTGIRTISATIRRAWTMDVVATGTYPPLAEGYSMTLIEYDCEQARYRGLQQNTYSATDEYLGGGALSGNWIFASPGSVGGSKLIFVCAVPGDRTSFGSVVAEGLTPLRHAVMYVFE